MKTRKSIRAVFALLLAAALLCGSLPVATAYTGGFDVYYVNSEGTRLTTSATDSTVGVSIRGGQATCLDIPETYDGYPVVRIEKLRSDDRYTGIRIPVSVQEIADPSFSTCRDLEWIEVDADNPYFYSVDGVLYQGNPKTEMTTLVCYPQQKQDESFTTYAGARFIGTNAFYANPYLKTLTIAIGQKSLTVGAISHCSALETLIFGEGPLHLNAFVIEACTALRTVHFSEWFADVYGRYFLSDFLNTSGSSDVTVCTAEYVQGMEQDARFEGYAYSVCGDAHTYAQQDIVSPETPADGIEELSDTRLFWYVPVYQSDEQGDYVKDENGVPITIGYSVHGTEHTIDYPVRVTIPSTYLGRPVIEIGNSFGYSFDNLISVHLPSTVQTIEPLAFTSCKTLEEITVDADSAYLKTVDDVLYTADGKTLLVYPHAKPDTALAIPEGTEQLLSKDVFCNGTCLRQLHLPGTFTDANIAESLANMTDLQRITVSANNPVFSADAAGALYNKDQTILLRYPPSGARVYTFPQSVTAVHDYALMNLNGEKVICVADGAQQTPDAYLNYACAARTRDGLVLHIPASVAQIRYTGVRTVVHKICSETRASQAAAFAAANNVDFYICNEDHSVLREPTDDDPPVPTSPYLTEDTYDYAYITEQDENGVSRVTGVCLRYPLETPDEPFVLTIPAVYRGVPVCEVNFAPQWVREHSAKVTKIELPATVRSISGVYNRAMLVSSVNAFRNLAAVTADEENPYLCTVDGVLFDKAMTRLILYPAAKADASYAIPDGVTDVKEGAFEGGYVFGNNPYLQRLTIPASFACDGRDSYGNASPYFNALLHLPALQSVTVDPGNPTFASDANGVLYSADGTQLILYPREATAEVFTIPASVDRILSPYTFRKPTYLRVLCVAEGATQTPEGNIRTTNAPAEYIHIPSSVQDIRLRIIGCDLSICSDSASCAAAEYAAKNGIPFCLCSEAHTHFTPVNPNEIQEDLFYFSYITEKDANGVTRYTGVNIRGLKNVPTEMIPLTIPETYSGLPVLQVSFHIWPQAQKEFFTRIELPKTVQSLNGNPASWPKEFANLRSIAVDAENPYFRSIDGVLFSKDLTTLIWYPAGKTTASYAIPAGVCELGSRGAFADNIYLQHLSLPASFTDFGTVMNDCFSGLRNLQSFSVAAGNPTYSSDENGVLYNEDKTTMILYPCANEAEQYTIPASVRRFGFYTPKYYPQHLRVLCIADGVTLVPSLSIRLGDSVQYLHIPSSVQDLSVYYETEMIAKSVTICSDSAESAAAGFARVWGYPFEVCTDHSAGTTPTEPLALTVSGGAARPGEIVQVTVDVTKNSGLVAARLHLSYDPSVLTLTGVQDAGLFDTATFVAGRDLSAVPYTVLWEDALTHTNHTATGTLVTYTFRVSESAEAGTTRVTLTYDENSTYDVDLHNIACSITNGAVTVYTRVAGDANGDGALDLKDVVLLRRFLAGGWNVTVDTDNMDVDGDGVISLKDCTLLSRFLAGGWNVTLR